MVRPGLSELRYASVNEKFMGKIAVKYSKKVYFFLMFLRKMDHHCPWYAKS